MAEAATNRPAITHRTIGNVGSNRCKRLKTPARDFAVLDVRRGDAGADRDGIIRLRT